MVATLALSQEQAAFLINMGLSALVTAGTATLLDMSEEEFQAELQKQQNESKEDEGNSGVTSDEIVKIDSTLH